MSLTVHFAPWFDADVHFRTAWYVEQGGSELAGCFVTSVESTVRNLAQNPHHGRHPFPKDPDLAQLRSVLSERPFQKSLLYYRCTVETLFLERLIHGARDLPRRLRQSPYESD